MTASDHLSDQQFFHGSNHKFEPGDEITPPSRRNRDPKFPSSDPERVYVSTSSKKYTDNQGYNAGARAFGRYVYRVKPHGDLKPDHYFDNAYSAEGATVIERHRAR